MGTIKNTLYWLEKHNALIKYQIKACTNNSASERKINLFSEDSVLPNFELLKSEILQILHTGDYSDDFVNTINRLYSLSEANSDLIVEANCVIKQFSQKTQQQYPIFLDLDKLSLDVFQFIHYNIFDDKDEYGYPINYIGFERVMTNLPEYYFKENNYILWQLYHFIPIVANTYTKQLLADFNNRKKLVSENEFEKLTQQYRVEHINKAIELSTNFCDRNFVSDYLLENSSIDKMHIVGYILSDMLEKLEVADYALYIEFDYFKYSPKYDWKFEKNSINDYSDLVALPQFEQLFLLLGSIFFVRELDTEEETITDAEIEISSEPDVGVGNTFYEEEITESVTVNEPVTKRGNAHLIDDEIPPKSDSIINEEKIRPDCIAKISILMQIHEEFNNILWEDISPLEFLNVFTNTIQRVKAFEIKDKTQFYYLLKRIWKNRTDVSTYKYEKEWLIPFLDTYDLSHSSYSNQFIEKEGAYNHRRFIEAVANIFPK